MDGIFGIGPLELILIAVLALIVLGPERLPGVMREGAKYIRQVRRMGNELTSQFSEELKMLDEINPRKILNEMTDPNQPDADDKSAATPAAPPTNAPAPAATRTPPAATNGAQPKPGPSPVSSAAAIAKASGMAVPPAAPSEQSSHGDGADEVAAPVAPESEPDEDAVSNSILPPDRTPSAASLAAQDGSESAGVASESTA